MILASNNPGKLHELQTLLQGKQITLIPQNTLGISEAKETACTFVENALIKARHASKCGKLPAIADDSGLVVPALQGAPGIYSARYSGKKDPDENIKKLLSEIHGLSRKAFFYCVLVYLSHHKDPTPLICEGIWHGEILKSPQGTQGFGYDPIFYVPEEQCSAAELSLEKKNQISHRGQALQQLWEKLCKRSL